MEKTWVKSQRRSRRLNRYAVESEQPDPWLLLGLERLAGHVIAVVERFREAEKIHNPVSTNDDSWDPVAPAPADIQGCESADNSS